MVTYRFRFKFNLSHKGMINGDDKEFVFKLPNGHEATLSCIGADSMKDSTWFAVTSGGYGSEEAALESGLRFKEAALCFGAKFRVGIDIGKDKAKDSLSNIVKDTMFIKHGRKVIDDVHGVIAYSEEYPTDFFSISANILIGMKNSDRFTSAVCKIIESPKNINEKVKVSMELITVSYFDSSPRSRFLTLILAAEALLDPECRPEETIKFVDSLIKNTNEAELDSLEKASILGSLNWLYKDSISNSLKKMAISHLPKNTYNNVPSDKFISKCYDARSKLVHSGSLDGSKHDLASLVSNLEVYMRDMVTKIAGI